MKKIILIIQICFRKKEGSCPVLSKLSIIYKKTMQTIGDNIILIKETNMNNVNNPTTNRN